MIAFGQPVKPTPDMLLSAFLEVYIEQRSGLRPGSITLYRQAVNQLGEFLGRDAIVSDLQDDTLGSFAGWVTARASVTTANIRLAALKAIGGMAHERGLLGAPLKIRKARVDYPTPTAWSPEEFARLMAACRAVKRKMAGMPAAAWWTALCSVVFDTGWRISAVLSICWKDADLAGGMLTVHAADQKHHRAETRFVAPDTIARLEAIRLPERELLFPWSMHPHYLQAKLKRILKAANLPHTRRDAFHKIRRTTASYIAARYGKAAAQEQLGHSRMSTTERYLDMTVVRPRNFLDALPKQ